MCEMRLVMHQYGIALYKCRVDSAVTIQQLLCTFSCITAFTSTRRLREWGKCRNTLNVHNNYQMIYYKTHKSVETRSNQDDLSQYQRISKTITSYAKMLYLKACMLVMAWFWYLDRLTLFLARCAFVCLSVCIKYLKVAYFFAGINFCYFCEWR